MFRFSRTKHDFEVRTDSVEEAIFLCNLCWDLIGVEQYVFGIETSIKNAPAILQRLVENEKISAYPLDDFYFMWEIDILGEALVFGEVVTTQNGWRVNIPTKDGHMFWVHIPFCGEIWENRISGERELFSALDLAQITDIADTHNWVNVIDHQDFMWLDFMQYN